jgi:hypothetical protein
MLLLLVLLHVMSLAESCRELVLPLLVAFLVFFFSRLPRLLLLVSFIPLPYSLSIPSSHPLFPLLMLRSLSVHPMLRSLLLPMAHRDCSPDLPLRRFSPIALRSPLLLLSMALSAPLLLLAPVLSMAFSLLLRWRTARSPRRFRGEFSALLSLPLRSRLPDPGVMHRLSTLVIEVVDVEVDSDSILAELLLGTKLSPLWNWLQSPSLAIDLIPGILSSFPGEDVAVVGDIGGDVRLFVMLR